MPDDLLCRCFCSLTFLFVEAAGGQTIHQKILVSEAMTSHSYNYIAKPINSMIKLLNCIHVVTKAQRHLLISARCALSFSALTSKRRHCTRPGLRQRGWARNGNISGWIEHVCFEESPPAGFGWDKVSFGRRMVRMEVPNA